MSSGNGRSAVQKIFDPQSCRWRKVRDVHHATYDDDGTYGTSEFVEFVVVGRNHEWPLLIPRKEFEMYNPDVAVAPARKE